MMSETGCGGDPCARRWRPWSSRAAGLGMSLQQHLGDDAERAFRADEQIAQRVAGDVLHALVAEPRHCAVGQDDFQAHDVVARDAVLRAAQAAGVLGHVAADGGDVLRAGIRRVEQAMSRRGLVDALVRHARLREQREVARIELEDLVHLREAKHDAAGARHAAAAQAGSRPARDDRRAARGRQADALGTLAPSSAERRPRTAAPSARPCHRSCRESDLRHASGPRRRRRWR